MNPRSDCLQADVVADYSKAKDKEWIITNGLGGYASSTIIGANTRAYHGLLVASLHPNIRRLLLLTKLEEEVIFNGEQHALSVNQYPDTIYPDGNKYLVEFRLDPLAHYFYQVGEINIEKTIDMLAGHNTSIISYKFDSPRCFEFNIRPLVNCRDFHSRTKEKSGLSFTQHPIPDGILPWI